MAFPSADSSLRRIPSTVTIRSFMTNTDSTMSGIPGPGRTLGRMLSAGGRRIEPALNRVAELLGYGPGAVVRRLLPLIQEEHVRSGAHFQHAGDMAGEDFVPATGAGGNLDPVLQTLINMVCFPCPVCSELSFSSLSVVKPRCRALLSRLIGYARLVVSLGFDIASADKTASPII